MLRELLMHCNLSHLNGQDAVILRKLHIYLQLQLHNDGSSLVMGDISISI